MGYFVVRRLYGAGVWFFNDADPWLRGAALH
jgi:hypothetical protein